MKNKRPFYDNIKNFFLVYVWSRKYNRYVNTNRFEDESEAIEAIKQRARS